MKILNLFLDQKAFDVYRRKFLYQNDKVSSSIRAIDGKELPEIVNALSGLKKEIDSSAVEGAKSARKIASDYLKSGNYTESNVSIASAISEVAKTESEKKALCHYLNLRYEKLFNKDFQKSNADTVFDDSEFLKNIDLEIASLDSKESKKEKYERSLKLLRKAGNNLVSAQDFGLIKALIPSLVGIQKSKLEELFKKQNKIYGLCIKAHTRIKRNNWDPEWSKASCFNAGNGPYNVFRSKNVQLNTYGWFQSDKTLLKKNELEGFTSSDVADILDANKGQIQFGGISAYKELVDTQYRRETGTLTPEEVSIEQQLLASLPHMEADPTKTQSIFEQLSKKSGIPFERISQIAMTSAPMLSFFAKNPRIFSKLSFLGTFGLYQSVIFGGMKGGGKGVLRAAVDFGEYMVPFHGNILDYKDAAYHLKQGNIWQAGMSIFTGTVGMALDLFSTVTIWTGIGPAIGQGGKGLVKGGLKSSPKIAKFLEKMFKEDIVGSFTRIAFKNPLDIGKAIVGKKSWKDVGLNLSKSSMRARTSTADGKFPANREYVEFQKEKVEAEIQNLEQKVSDGDTSSSTQKKLQDLQRKKESLKKDGIIAAAMNMSDADLTAQKSSLETKMVPLEQKITELQKLKEEYQTEKKSFDDLEVKGKALETEIADLTQKEKGDEGVLKNAEKKLEAYQKDQKTLRQKNDEIEKAKKELETLKEKEKTLKKLFKLDPDLVKNGKQKTNKERYEESIEEIHNKNKLISKLEGERIKFENDFRSKYGKNPETDLKSQVEAAKTSFEETKSQKNSKEQEYSDLLKTYKNSEKLVHTKKTEIVRFTKEVNSETHAMQDERMNLDVINDEINERGGLGINNRILNNQENQQNLDQGENNNGNPTTTPNQTRNNRNAPNSRKNRNGKSLSPLSVKFRRRIKNLNRIVTDPLQLVVKGASSKLNFWSTSEGSARRFFGRNNFLIRRTRGINSDFKDFQKKYLDENGNWKNRKFLYRIFQGRVVRNNKGDIESLADIEFILKRANTQKSEIEKYHRMARPNSPDKFKLKRQLDTIESVIDKMESYRSAYFIHKKTRQRNGLILDNERGLTRKQYLELTLSEKSPLQNYISIRVQSDGVEKSIKKAEDDLKQQLKRGVISKEIYNDNVKSIQNQFKTYKDETIEGATRQAIEKNYSILKEFSIPELVNLHLFQKLPAHHKSADLLSLKKVEGAAVHVDITSRKLNARLIDPKIKEQFEICIGGKSFDKNSPQTVIGLAGIPGAGKTYAAQLLAKQNNANYIEISQLAYKYVGESGEKIRAAFGSIRKNKPAVVLMDELDQAISSGGDASGDMIKALQEELENVSENQGIVFVWGSNFPQNMPDAIMSRTKSIIHVKPSVDPDNVGDPGNLQRSIETIEEMMNNPSIGCDGLRRANIRIDTPAIKDILQKNPWASIRDYRNIIELCSGKLVLEGNVNQARFESEFSRLMSTTTPSNKVKEMYKNAENASGLVSKIEINIPGREGITMSSNSEFVIEKNSLNIKGLADPISVGTSCKIHKIVTNAQGEAVSVKIRDEISAIENVIPIESFKNMFESAGGFNGTRAKYFQRFAA